MTDMKSHFQLVVCALVIIKIEWADINWCASASASASAVRGVAPKPIIIKVKRSIDISMG